ncbi:hypothetical protein ZIOFF_063384 [Zingiber officinale]|uniref:Mei2-like C-terminal RNA recognition motif domain-containing protein n=1 Tax=Zingiber officinale TaxID=94328 RepID=A0A8J5KK31_ZINOF|nr:hypothetical protein ZIOFF_063384 [Zingiber officinale]
MSLGLMQQMTHDFEQDETRGYWHHMDSPITNSPPVGGVMSAIGNNHLPGLASVLSPISTSAKIAPIGKDQNRGGLSNQKAYGTSQLHGGGHHNSHSLPDHTHGLLNPSPGNSTSFGSPTPNVSVVGTLSAPQFLWGSSSSYNENMQSSVWQSQTLGNSYVPNGQGQGQSFPYPLCHGSMHGSLHKHNSNYSGSAPSVFPFDKQYGFIPKSPEISFTNHIAIGNIGVNQNDLSFMNITPPATMNQGMMSGNMPDNGSPNMGMMPAHRFGPLLFRNAACPGPTSIGFDGFVDWNRSRRVDNHGNQAFNGKKWEKFNSEKVASLAYARIQGKAALVAHFQNSSLMNEDKRCRPIVFDSAGMDAGDQVSDEDDLIQSSSMHVPREDGMGGDSPESPRNQFEVYKDLDAVNSVFGGFSFEDDMLMHGNWANEPTVDTILLYHNAIPEPDEKTGNFTYKMESSDKATFLVAAREFGFEFCKKTQSSVFIREKYSSSAYLIK